MNNYKYITSECVSEGHPDKISDQIADGILDQMLLLDPKTRICCEVFVTTNFILIGGEYRTKAHFDIEKLARKVLEKIGYTNRLDLFSSQDCEVNIRLHPQSEDIVRGVDKEDDNQGAGDQGIIFGYATNETEDYLPLPYVLSRNLLLKLKEIRNTSNGVMNYLKPDAKSQVTVKYDKDEALFVDTIVISTHHEDFLSDTSNSGLSAEEREVRMLEKIKSDIIEFVINEVVPEKYLNDKTRILVNPTGKFVIGGPNGDAGLTNRKIIVDTYGGACPHGGGGMSGKDASKVDRSAAYMTRYIAKNMVAAKIADKVLIQLAYAIGVADPVSIFVNTYGTSHLSISDEAIASVLFDSIDFSPSAIESLLKLYEPKYSITASYGHMGRTPIKNKEHDLLDGADIKDDIHFFSWEELSYVEEIDNIFKDYR